MSEKQRKIVVVGGVAGGMSFAARYRRLNEHDQITVLEKGPYVSFANCGLPYYVSGEISERDDLLVITQETLEKRFKLDIRVNHEVTKINRDEKTVVVKSGQDTFELEYDELILSPGASPFIPPIKGVETADYMFTLRNIPDVDKITEYIDNKKPEKAVVVGAGFIGLEMAENLKQKGMDVTVVEMAPQILPPLDVEMAKMAENELRNAGVEVITNDSLVELANHTAILDSGKELEADIVILSVGVVPETKFAQDAGIEVGMRGGLVVDDKYTTSDKNIHAVGDAIIVKNQISDADALIPLASPANRQGRQLADVLNDLPSTNKGSIGTSILRLFNLSIASTGLNEKQLEDRNYDAIHLLGKDHAGYFPGATDIYLKVIYDLDTLEILGAQAVGEKGVDKRIDILATAIKAGYNIIELQELELTYAPPFGTAKDIVNQAGYVAENKHLGLTDTVQWHELEDLVNEGYQIVDVRNDDEVEETGVILNAQHIPLDELRDRMDEIDSKKPVIVYCRSSVRSYNAERILTQHGYEAYNLDGSISLYSVIKPENISK